MFLLLLIFLELIHILDQNTNWCFLVDTGASYSILLSHNTSLLCLHWTVAFDFGPAGQLIPSEIQENLFRRVYFMADVAFPMHPRCGFSQIPQPADVSTQQLAPGQHRAAARMW